MNLKNVTSRGYVYYKPIFWIIFFIITTLVIYIFYQHNFDLTPDVYFECDAPECKNPLYLSECKARVTVLFFIPLYTSKDCRDEPGYAWLNEPILSRGSYGQPPPEDFLYNYIRLICILIFLSGMLANHFIFNRGRPFDIEIPITKKLIINRDWLDERLKK